MDEKALFKALLKYISCPDLKKEPVKSDFGDWNISKEAAKLISKDPNAFLFAAIFDRGIWAEDAWERPYQLKKRLGHLDIEKIAKMPQDELALEIGPHKYGKGESLHRYYNVISKSIILASELLLKKYEGNAANIWPNSANAEDVASKLLEFHGIGQKISNMLLIFLIKYYGVRLSNLGKIDIAVDINVARVFLRTGLITAERGKTSYSVREIKESIIQKARELYPEFPGALDEPAYDIGREWCTAEGAYCDYEKDPCPLTKVCTKRKRDYQVH